MGHEGTGGKNRKHTGKEPFDKGATLGSGEALIRSKPEKRKRKK